MPTYKDEKTNTWYCKFYYQDCKRQIKARSWPPTGTDPLFAVTTPPP